MKLTVVLPCYNEEENIARIPEVLIPELQKLGCEYEILLIDDGSTDNGVNTALALGIGQLRVIRHERNMGLGAALKTGIKNATGDLLVTLDSDFTFHPRYIRELLARFSAGDVDFVLGSPWLAGFGADIQGYRVFISILGNFIYSVLLGRRVTAVSPVFRIYKTAQLKELMLETNGFSISAEILLSLILAGRTFAEVPTPLARRQFGHSKLNYRKEIRHHLFIVKKIIVWRVQSILLKFVQLRNSRHKNNNFLKMVGRHHNRVKDALFLLIPFAVFLTIFGPLVFDKMFIFNSNLLDDTYPRWTWVKSELMAGRLPLWAPNFVHGFPMYLDQFNFFHPITLLLIRLLPWLIAFNSWLVLLFLVAIIASYFFARELNLSRPAAIFATIAYVFAGQQMIWAQEPGWTANIALFPLFLLVVSRLRAGSLTWAIVGVLAVVHAVLGAYIELTIYALLLAFIWALVLDLQDGFRRTWLSTTRRFCLIAAVGVFMVSPWLLPAVQFVAMSVRAQGCLDIAGKQFLGLGDMVQSVLPNIDVPIMNPFARIFWNNMNVNIFMGVWPFLFAIYATAKFLGSNLRIKFFLFIAIFCLSVAIPFLPIYDILHSLPLLRSFRAAWKWLMPFTFALAMLAGLGFDAFFRNKEKPSKRQFSILVAIGVGVVISMVTVFLILTVFQDDIIKYLTRFFDEQLYVLSPRINPATFYHPIIADMVSRLTSFLDPREPVALAAYLPFLGMIFLPLLLKKQPSGQLAKCLVIVTLAAALIFQARHLITFRDKEWWEHVPQSVKFLQQHADGFRYYAVQAYLGAYPDPLNKAYLTKSFDLIRETAPLNWNLHYGLDAVGNRNGLVTVRAARILQVLDRAEESEIKSFGPLYLKPPKLETVLPLLQMMGVRYVVSPAPMDKIFSEKQHYRMPDELHVFVYETPDALPRVYFARAGQFVPEDEERAFLAIRTVSDFRATTVLECNSCTQTDNYRSSTRDTIEVEKYEPGTLRIKTDTDGPRWVVFNEAELGNWRVTIDGEPVPIVKANYLYQAVLVPAGEHEVLWHSLGWWQRFVASLQQFPLFKKQKASFKPTC